MSHHHSQLQLRYSCITASCGLSPMARKKRMFFRTFFTWKNTFFATLSLKQQKQEHMDCFWTYKHSCMFMYISSELYYFSLYKYNKLARQILKSLHTEFPLLFHVNIQEIFIKALQQKTTKQASNIFNLL